jgi:hypothetical protein
LSLRDNGLGAVAARALAGSPYLGQLRVLDLADNALGGTARKVLMERFGAGVCRF